MGASFFEGAPVLWFKGTPKELIFWSVGSAKKTPKLLLWQGIFNGESILQPTDLEFEEAIQFFTNE